MPETSEPMESVVPDGVTRHDHLCLPYEGEAEILSPVIPFIQKGIALGERCIYLNAGEETLERVLKNAVLGQKHDIGALILLPAQETWLKGGSFDVQRVMELLRTLCSGAAGDGFKGTRIMFDMGWAGEGTRMELLQEFELALNLFAVQNDVTLLCLYNREDFPAERMLELARIHPRLLIGGKACGNPLFIPPDRDPHLTGAACELDVFLAAARNSAAATAEGERLQQELEQAYSALARKIYENWQEEDTLRASEKEIHEKDEALLTHKRRLQTVLQHLPAMLMAFDAGDRLAACNHEFERVTGFKVEEVLGKPMLELLQVEGEAREEVVAAHPPQGGDYRGREWSLRCKDGLKRVSWFNISRYVPIPGWTNWITGLDVSQKVQAESRLRSLSEELDARTGELEAFGCAVSNDLSGQLAAISDRCATIREVHGATLSPRCREMLQGIRDITVETAGRIAALKRLTVLVAGGFQPEEVDLSAMASEIAAQLKGTGGDRPVTFRIEDGVTATGDKKLLRLAMEQLMENAWSYTLSVLHPVIRFGTAQVEGERSFYVSDNGPRSAAAEGAQTPPRESDNGGCGIGLATVQRIITLHRGRIWAADEAGNGGTLYFQV